MLPMGDLRKGATLWSRLHSMIFWLCSTCAEAEVIWKPPKKWLRPEREFAFPSKSLKICLRNCTKRFGCYPEDKPHYFGIGCGSSQVGQDFAIMLAKPVQNSKIFTFVFRMMTATVTEIIKTSRMYSSKVWPLTDLVFIRTS